MGIIIGIILLLGGLLEIFFSGISVLGLSFIILSIFIFFGSLKVFKSVFVKIIPMEGAPKLVKWIKPLLLGLAGLIIIMIAILSKGTNPAWFEEGINTAAGYIQSGELKKAEKLLEDLYDEDPNNGAVNLNFAALYLSQGETEEAKPFLDAAAKRLYHDEMLYFDYGMYYYQLEDYYNALINFEKAIQINPSFVAANIYAGTMSYDLRDLKRSIYHLESANYLMPENPEILLYLGKANKDLMNYPQAEEALNLALDKAEYKDLKELINDELDELESFKEGILQ